jgi:hypothetical protein
LGVEKIGQTRASGVPRKIEPGSADKEVGVVVLVESDEGIVVDEAIPDLEQTVEAKCKPPVGAVQAEPLVVEHPEGVFLGLLFLCHRDPRQRCEQ